MHNATLKINTLFSPFLFLGGGLTWIMVPFESVYSLNCKKNDFSLSRCRGQGCLGDIGELSNSRHESGVRGSGVRESEVALREWVTHRSDHTTGRIEQDPRNSQWLVPIVGEKICARNWIYVWPSTTSVSFETVYRNAVNWLFIYVHNKSTPNMYGTDCLMMD